MPVMTETALPLEGPGRDGCAILRTTLTSPYGRKTRMALEVLGLSDRVEIVPADTRDPEDDLRAQNPLGKMPCLLVADQSLYDSRVIVEYLDAVAGGGRLIPRAGMDRFRCLTHVSLADGVTDAALLMVYEGRFRDEAQISERWLSHQRGKLQRGLTRLCDILPDPKRTDAFAISLACGLGYLDWRAPIEWREDWPVLAQWLAEFAAAEPAFKNTEAPQ